MSDYSTVAPPQSNINQSQAFAAALQRAKQIAAKIQPTGQQQQSQPQQQLQGGGGYKRSLNDDDSAGPDAKKFSSPDSYNSQQGGGNMSQALAQAAAVAARLAATAGNTTEEQLRIPEAIVSHLVMGRNSSDNISHIQAESGCKVQLSQESERTVTVRGSRDAVTKGREMIQQMATQHGGGTVEIVLSITMPPPGPTGYPPYQEIMVPGAKVGLVIGKGGETIKMLQEKTGAKMVIIQDGPNQEVIKPLRISGDPQKIEHAKSLVFELIQDKDNVRPGGFNNSNGSGGESAEVFVPKVAVGVVIGKGGDMIKKIQGETGCKLQFIQGKNDEPGDRRCIIQGSRQQVEDAKRMIEGLIESVMQRSQANNRNNNGGGGGGGGGNGGGGGQQADNTNSNYGYGYGVNHTQQAPREEVTFSVPASKCGIVIGRGGETIKLINQQTGAYCEMDRSAVNPPSEKMFKSKGTPEQIEHARQMISEKINIDLVILSRKPIGNAPNHQNNYNNNGMQSDPNAAAYQQQWAGYAQQGGWDQSQQQQQQQQQQMNPMAQPGAAGQADYSTQWIEYYKSMGMHREAEMIEQQLKAKQAMSGVGPTNPSMPAAAPQMAPQPQVQPQQQPQQQVQQQQQQQQQAQAQAPDYSAQWAEYYRSIGKVDEAEAIEKQMGKGVASNGQASAQPSVSAPTQPAAAAAAPQQPVAGGYPQGMTPSQYAQYSQYYAAAAAAGQPGGYPQQAYPGYGYPSGPQPGMPGGPQSGAGGPPNPQQQHKQQNNKPNDKK